MKLFDKCPVCGGEIVEKEVEKLLKGGTNTAVLRVEAEVCLKCGERFYAPDIARKFDEIRRKLEREELEGLVLIGKAFKVA